jgi:hypothetical protein
MKTIGILLVGGILILTSLATAATQPGFLVASTNVLVAYLDQEVLFTLKVDCPPTQCPEKVELKMLDDKEDDGVKARWPMMDNGLTGDQEAGDKVYSRTVQFKEKKLDTLLFSVNPTHIVAITVTPRPTLIEILQGIWKKLAN